MDEDRPFHFHHPVDVRFKDIDVGGHAHHSHALVYFEEARSAYWREVVGRHGAGAVDYILAEASIRYHGRILWPQRLRVGVRVGRLGRKHFEMVYEVAADDRETPGERLISGRTVQVMYDYGKGVPKRMPLEVRAAIEALEGPFGRDGGARGP